MSHVHYVFSSPGSQRARTFPGRLRSERVHRNRSGVHRVVVHFAPQIHRERMHEEQPGQNLVPDSPAFGDAVSPVLLGKRVLPPEALLERGEPHHSTRHHISTTSSPSSVAVCSTTPKRGRKAGPPPLTRRELGSAVLLCTLFWGLAVILWNACAAQGAESVNAITFLSFDVFGRMIIMVPVLSYNRREFELERSHTTVKIMPGVSNYLGFNVRWKHLRPRHWFALVGGFFGVGTNGLYNLWARSGGVKESSALVALTGLWVLVPSLFGLLFRRESFCCPKIVGFFLACVAVVAIGTTENTRFDVFGRVIYVVWFVCLVLLWGTASLCMSMAATRHMAKGAPRRGEESQLVKSASESQLSARRGTSESHNDNKPDVVVVGGDVDERLRDNAGAVVVDPDDVLIMDKTNEQEAEKNDSRPPIHLLSFLFLLGSWAAVVFLVSLEALGVNTGFGVLQMFDNSWGVSHWAAIGAGAALALGNPIYFWLNDRCDDMSLVSPLTGLYVVWPCVFGFLLLGGTASPQQLGGIVCAIVGAALLPLNVEQLKKIGARSWACVFGSIGARLFGGVGANDGAEL